MAGVASGLALATTLMAMQVADTMSARTCPYRPAQVQVQRVGNPNHGFLGITYVQERGGARVERVLANTPAAEVGLRRNDLVLSVNGEKLDHVDELESAIFGMRPGTQPRLIVERAGEQRELRPTLMPWPAITY